MGGVVLYIARSESLHQTRKQGSRANCHWNSGDEVMFVLEVPHASSESRSAYSFNDYTHFRMQGSFQRRRIEK